MFSFNTNFLRASLIAAAAFCSTSAMATTVIGTLNSFGTGDSITLHAVTPGGTPIAQQVLSGVASFSRTGGTEAATLSGPNSGSYYAFCIEPFESTSIGSNYTYTVAPLTDGASSSIVGGLGATKATQIAELFGQFAPNLASPLSAVQASALQIATWEIVGEASTNALNVLSGNLFFSTPASADFNDVITLAQSYLNYVTSANGLGAQAQGLQALTISGKQDFLVQTVSAAPEPATWMTMILGFGLIGYALRARRGNAAATANPSEATGRAPLSPDPSSARRTA